MRKGREEYIRQADRHIIKIHNINLRTYKTDDLPKQDPRGKEALSQVTVYSIMSLGTRKRQKQKR